MAFRPINLSKLNSTPNPVLNPSGSQIKGASAYTYNTAEDALATVSGASYFNIANPKTTDYGLLTPKFAVGDLIWAHATDGNVFLQVTAAGSTVTTTVYSTILDGSIDTADLADLAVTTAKLDAGAVTTAKITDANVTLAKLAAGITPSHVIKFAGQPTTAGGAAAEAFAVAGILATDLAFVQVVDDGTSNVTALQAVCTVDTLTVTFSADPGNDTVINYQILRAAA